MLPPDLPHLDGYEVVGVCRPARQVASDLFDWTETRDGRLVTTLADVMGRGLGSALVMAQLRTALRMAPEGRGPAARVRQVADTMTFGPAEEGLFVELFHAELEPATGRVRYVDAGHGLGLVRRADGAVESLKVRSLPL
jgi:serine phosphatase RsbU (regulator of sigma subunit)